MHDRAASGTAALPRAIGLGAIVFCSAHNALPNEGTIESSSNTAPQIWSWNVQNTIIVQGAPAFHAPYSGPNSLNPDGEVKETVSLDLYLGLRLWRGAEAHIDGLMWQGFGLSDATGVDGFPNGEAFRLGTSVPNVNFPRIFIRQTIGLGGGQEDVEDSPLQLRGKQDLSRLTFTVGRFSAKDIFDGNSYANDARIQFLNWGLMANEAWDYPADALGFTTGLAIELNQPTWALRYGFFQVPKSANGVAIDMRVFRAWGMVLETEKRWTVCEHPGVARVLGFLNSARMGDYQEAVDNPTRPADIEATREYRLKYGFGLNLEQEIVTNLRAFCRLGWNEGHHEAWMFSDVDHTATAGVSLKGEAWHRSNDTFGLAGVFNGITRPHRRFFQAGGVGILAGDGALNYGLEKVLETYYDFEIWKTIHGALDYQYVVNPAFNRDRGPVSIFAARLHWEL